MTENSGESQVTIKNDTKLDDTQHLSESSCNSRILKLQTLFFTLLSAVALFIFIAISLYNQMSVARYQKMEFEITQLMNPLVVELGELIEKDNIEVMQKLIDSASHDAFVITANVFTVNSEILVSSTLDYKSNVQMRINYINNPSVRFYLAPILLGHKQLGFLQLQIAHDKMYRNFGMFNFDMSVVILSLFIFSLLLGTIIFLMFKRLQKKLTQG